MKYNCVDNVFVCAMFLYMSLNKLRSLCVGICLGVSVSMPLLLFCAKKPVNTGKKHYQNILVYTDTVNVNCENFESIKRSVPAGVFNPHKNSVCVNYFSTTTTCKDIIAYCDLNNGLCYLSLAHEMAHARKAHMTKNVSMYSPLTRGRVAAMNEIMAPAYEIITYLEARNTDVLSIPKAKSFVASAASQIDALGYNRYTVMFYKDSRVADIILECALCHFLDATRHGLYKTTIARNIDGLTLKKYVPNVECDNMLGALFNPESGEWDALWEFKMSFGSVNLWHVASDTQKRRVINSVDSLINEITGKNAIFLKNSKNHQIQ